MTLKLPQEYEAYYKEWEERIHAFIEFCPSQYPGTEKDPSASSGSAADKSMEGLPFAISDNIALEGSSFSSGSKMLEGLKSPFTATAVKKLLAAGCIPAGKTNLDEFGMGSSAEDSGIMKTYNPWNTEHALSGSCGGGAAAVAAGLVPFVLGSDTGGAIRQAAASCGIPGLKPGFGAVSRFGLSSFAGSLESIGVLGDSVSRCRRVFNVIRGMDPMDQTSHDPQNTMKKEAASHGRPSEKKSSCIIGVLNPGSGLPGAFMLDEDGRACFELARANLAALGYTLKEIELPWLKYAAPAYYTIAAAEASANLARFDGIRFGKRPDWADNPDELMDKARIGGFGDEAKLQVLAGTYVLRSGLQDRYYMQAQRIRAHIISSLDTLLGKPGDEGSNAPAGGASFDALLLPVFPARTDPPLNQNQEDVYTCCANLAGLPSLSFPVSEKGGLPMGVQLMGRSFTEETLLDIAEDYENAHPFPHPKGYRKFWNQERS